MTHSHAIGEWCLQPCGACVTFTFRKIKEDEKIMFHLGKSCRTFLSVCEIFKHFQLVTQKLFPQIIVYVANPWTMVWS